MGHSIKVLQLSPRLFVPGRPGGGERYTSELVKALRSHSDLEINVVVGESYTALRQQQGEIEDWRPCSIRDLFRAIRDVDVVHLHQLNSHLSDLAFAGCRRYRRPLILTDHGGGWRSYGRIFARARLRYVSGLACVSRTSMEDLGWNPLHSNVILYGGGDHLPPPAEPPISKCHMAYIGRLLPHKGAALLLKALPPDVSCIIAGRSSDQQYAEYLHELARNKQVEFVESPNDQELADIYAGARWNVSPSMEHRNGKKISRPELLGITPIEACLAGTPSLLSNIPAFREIAPLVDANTFQADSDSSLREHIVSALEMKRDSFLVTQEMRTMFSWKTVAEKAVSLYETVLH